MKSLLAVTRFMMEDTLRSLVLDNHVKYVTFVNTACGAKVTMLALHVPNSIPLHSDVVHEESSKDSAKYLLMLSAQWCDHRARDMSPYSYWLLEPNARTFTGVSVQCGNAQKCAVLSWQHL